jgi:hypothetical protein
MAVIIKNGTGIEATIEGYTWRSDDPLLEALLNSYLDVDGPSGSDPFPDLTAATEAVKRLGAGAKIVQQDPLPPPTDPNVVF